MFAIGNILVSHTEVVFVLHHFSLTLPEVWFFSHFSVTEANYFQSLTTLNHEKMDLKRNSLKVVTKIVFFLR